MDNLIAYCEINCNSCSLYIATVNKDVSLKMEVATNWGKMYNRIFKIEDMECLGCKSKKVFMLCKKCDIKSCNENKAIETCSQCDNYPCNRIEKFHKWQEKQDTKVEIITKK